MLIGHHIDDEGRFQSDKHPELPPDRIRVNFTNPRSQRALWALAEDYEDKDPELSADIKARLLDLGYGDRRGEEVDGRVRIFRERFSLAIDALQKCKVSLEGL